MPANAISATRLIGGAILFWLPSLFIKTEKPDRDSLSRSFFGGLAIAGCLILFVLSLNYGSAIDISIIMTLPPVFVILIEAIFLKRHPSLTEYGGVALSFVGAAMVILTGSSAAGMASGYLPGDFLAVSSSACFAIYLVVLAKPSDIYKPVSLLRWVFLFGSLPALFLIPGFLMAALSIPPLRSPGWSLPLSFSDHFFRLFADAAGNADNRRRAGCPLPASHASCGRPGGNSAGGGQAPLGSGRRNARHHRRNAVDEFR